MLLKHNYVNLTRSGPSDPCTNDVTEYTCTTNALEVQWSVQPTIEDNIVRFANNPSTDGTVSNIGPDITIRQESSGPLVTVMTISGSLSINSSELTVICLDTINNIVNQSSYLSGSE